MIDISAVEKQTLQRAIVDPEIKSGLQKIFTGKALYFTDLSRDFQNCIPEGLDQQAQFDAMARQYAAKAAVWRVVWAEIEKVANG